VVIESAYLRVRRVRGARRRRLSAALALYIAGNRQLGGRLVVDQGVEVGGPSRIDAVLDGPDAITVPGRAPGPRRDDRDRARQAAEQEAQQARTTEEVG
jgi:hypothetical protein